MSDIGVAEIPVDEEERPLPPPPAPVKNALVDGPILCTLLSATRCRSLIRFRKRGCNVVGLG